MIYQEISTAFVHTNVYTAISIQFEWDESFQQERQVNMKMNTMKKT